jgi:phosphatidylglycerophosphatase A
MILKDEAVVFLATGFYVGNIPFAPGTLGSLLGLPLCFFLSAIRLQPAMVLALIFIIFATWIAHVAEKVLKRKDPGCIVIDEIAGMVVALIGLPFNLTTVVCGFIIFRVLDILKPFPIKILDKNISGGIGIVADDVVAGILTNLILRVIIAVLYSY